MIKAGGVVLLALMVLAVGFINYARWGEARAVGALGDAGYGEMTLRAASASPCRFGEIGRAFLAQGRGKPEATGYVCASPFHATTIHVAALPEADKLDWD